MSSDLAGLLILAVMLTGALVMWRITLASNTAISRATKTATELEGEQTRTIPNITAATGNRNNNTLTVTVKNDGATSVALSDLPKMEVIVIYDGSVPAARRFTYTATAPSASRPMDQDFDFGRVRARRLES